MSNKPKKIINPVVYILVILICGAFGSGLHLVSKSNEQNIDQYGIIDNMGEYLVQPVYDYIGEAYEYDYYYVIYQGERAYLDRDFNFVTEMAGDNLWQPGAWSEKDH